MVETDGVQVAGQVKGKPAEQLVPPAGVGVALVVKHAVSTGPKCDDVGVVDHPAGLRDAQPGSPGLVFARPPRAVLVLEVDGEDRLARGVRAACGARVLCGEPGAPRGLRIFVGQNIEIWICQLLSNDIKKRRRTVGSKHITRR